MERSERETRKLRELHKGDIIHMRIPYEENTADYYNGYDPKEIRGHLYRNKDGETSKPRMVVVVGHDGNSIQYLPLTSRHESSHDSEHQYTLRDNSMTRRKDPSMKSYVEVDSLRSVYANPEWDISYTGRVTESDMANIMSKLGKKEINFNSKRDQRAYVSRNNDTAFERRLKENGYDLDKEQYQGKIYKKEDGRTVTKSRWGLVQYHVPLPKEEVAEMVSRREGMPVGVSLLMAKKSADTAEDFVDDFAKAVMDLTEKTNKESGVSQ